jgi:hypothetical protein
MGVPARQVHEYLESLAVESEERIDDLTADDFFDDIAKIINENMILEVEASLALGKGRIIRA